jgi:hypothetical protein
MLGDTANEKRWVIIACEWAGDGRFGPLIPADGKPSTFQATRDQAEAELLRLEAKYQRAFALFESVAYAKRVGGPDRISDDPATPFAYVVEPITNE